MRWTKIAVLTVGVGALACQSTPSLSPAQTSVARDQISTRLRSMEQFINNRQIDSVLTLYRDSETLDVGWSYGVRTVGKAEYEAELNNFYNSLQFLNLNLQNPTVNVLSPTAAVVRFRYSIDVQLNDTSRDPYSGLGLQVWTRADEDSSWVIDHHIMSRTVR